MAAAAAQAARTLPALVCHMSCGHVKKASNSISGSHIHRGLAARLHSYRASSGWHQSPGKEGRQHIGWTGA